MQKICPQRDLYKNVPIYNSHKQARTQMSLNKRMNKQTGIFKKWNTTQQQKRMNC